MSTETPAMAWIGGYPADSGTEQHGIRLLTADEAGQPAETHWVGTAESPSWLARHDRAPVLYAAQESAGTLAAFRIDGQALTPIGEIPAGETVCHLLVQPDHLIASCYGDGNVVRVELPGDGSFGERSLAVPSIDPHAAEGARQSRAHCSASLGDGHIVVSDLGHDQLRFFDTAGVLQQIGTVVLPMGSGPRHLWVHSPSKVSVITEYSCQVITVERIDDGPWRIISTVALLAGEVPADAAGAELTGSSDGALLYAGVRGPDLIVTLDATATTVLGRTASGARWPRHHRQLGDRLLVANQESDEISVLQIDPATGLPGDVVGRISTPAPAHILVMAAGQSGM